MFRLNDQVPSSSYQFHFSCKYTPIFANDFTFFQEHMGPLFILFQVDVFISYFPRHLLQTNAPVSGKTVTEIMPFVFHPLCLKREVSLVGGSSLFLPNFVQRKLLKTILQRKETPFGNATFCQKSAISQFSEILQTLYAKLAVNLKQCDSSLEVLRIL